MERDLDCSGHNECSPPIAIVIVSEGLQEDNDERHQRFNQAELECCLFAEPQETDGVGFSGQAARPVEAGRLDGFAADLRHDVALTAEVLVAERQEIVDYERC